MPFFMTRQKVAEQEVPIIMRRLTDIDARHGTSHAIYTAVETLLSVCAAAGLSNEQFDTLTRAVSADYVVRKQGGKGVEPKS